MMSCMWCELQTCHTWLDHVKSWRWVSWVCGNCFKLSSSISVNILFYRIGLYCESIILIKTKQKSLQFSCSVVSDFLQPHEPQHASPPCPLLTPGVYPNSCPLSRWCHPAISSSVILFSSCPQSLPASVFSNESTLHMRLPKYWSFSFSISLSNEHPGRRRSLSLSRFSAFRVFRYRKRKWNPITMKMQMQIQRESGG